MSEAPMVLPLPRKALHALAALIDIAYYARPTPVPLKAFAARHGLPPRHLEAVMQRLVRAGILTSTRGPRGGYALARERRRITLAEVVAIAGAEENEALPYEAALRRALDPAQKATRDVLNGLTLEDLVQAAQDEGLVGADENAMDFTI